MRFLCLITLVACVDYGVNPNDKGSSGPRDSGTGCPPSIPDCHDTGTEVDTQDSSVEDPDDCDVAAEAAGTTQVLDECVGTGSGGEVTDPYDLQIEYQYTSDASGPVVKTSVINLTDDDGDGAVTVRDIPDIAFTVYQANELIVLSGDGSGEILRQTGWNGAGDIVTADVDADGDVEICGFDTSGHIQCVDASGRREWTSRGTVSNGYPHITACDLDQDGAPEVIGDTLAVNGEDGTTVFTVASSGKYTVPVCADIDRDGTAELLLGPSVYSHTGATEWTMPASGMTAMAAVVNVDSDDNAEVFLVSDRLYLYDDDGSPLNATTIPTQNPGPPCAADFDGDGEVEIAVPSGTKFYMFDTDGSQLWAATMQDNSGLAGCSGYDMDGDSIYEVLFADEVAVRLYDGATGAVLYESYAHNSGTLFEYPVIADVDLDGSAEILIAENLGALMGITVYGHAGDGWPASGPTWPTHDFAVTNIEADGTIPAVPEESWLRYNVFRARPAVDDPSSPDLTGRVVDVCVADCENGPIKISVQVENQGGSDIAAGVSWALYGVTDGVRTLITTGRLEAVASGTSTASFEVEVAPAQMGEDGFVVVLDDDGTGAGVLTECDDDNNEIAYTDTFCP